MRLVIKGCERRFWRLKRGKNLFPSADDRLESQILLITIKLLHPLLKKNDWLVWSPCSPTDSQESFPALQYESINSSALSLPMVQLLHPYDHWKIYSFDYMDLCFMRLLHFLTSVKIKNISCLIFVHLYISGLFYTELGLLSLSWGDFPQYWFIRAYDIFLLRSIW